MNTRKIVSGFSWKLFERLGVQGVQFILQLLLARLLAPEHYGVLSIMLIFISLANVFVQNGFSSSLVQDKDVTDEDYSSVFWISFLIATLLYAVLFVTAPLIAFFYQMPTLVAPLRVLSLMLFPSVFNAVQQSKILREMDFRKVFFSNVTAIAVSGVAGVVAAFFGLGLWALVIYQLLHIVIACAVMYFTVDWRLRLVCNMARVKVLFSFGWKLLVSNLLNTLYQDLRSLVIGKKYNSSTLGFYNRGKQFPQLIMNTVNSAVQGVMFPALSAEQNDRARMKAMMRRSIAVGSFLIFPIMTGLALVAPALVELLLTERWLPCVPFMQIYCFSFAFYPIHSCNLQAVTALGRSDLFLKLEIIKKIMGVALLVIAVVFFDSPIAIALTGLISTVICFFINAQPVKALVKYSYFEQLRDLIPATLLSLAMCAPVLLVSTLSWHPIYILLVQVAVGAAVYIGAAFLFNVSSCRFILNLAKQYLHKK